jgi:NAD(P)-dependent dehydrogenase (short-subunit alcohol dehydrogenase family)
MALDTRTDPITTGPLSGARILVSGGARGLGAAVCDAVELAGATALAMDVRSSGRELSACPPASSRPGRESTGPAPTRPTSPRRWCSR